MYSSDVPTDLPSLTAPIKIRTMDHIRMRPGMYLGALDHRGISTLLDEVFALFLNTGGLQPRNIALRFLGSGAFQIEAESDFDWLQAIQELDPFAFLSSPLSMLVLRAVSKRFVVHYNGRQYFFSSFAELQHWQAIPDHGRGWMRLEFELDSHILDASQFPTSVLAERMRLLAMLYPQATLHFQDETHPTQPSARYHFPEGLQQLYTDRKAALGVDTLCDLHFQGRWAGNGYQIAFGFATRPLGQASIRSFANTLETKGHGSLVDGVLEGIQKAIQFKIEEKYIPWRPSRRWMDNPPLAATPTAKISRAKVRAHLVLVAAIDGDGLEFHHPTRDKLHSKAAAHAGREIAYHLVMEEFERDPASLSRLSALLAQA